MERNDLFTLVSGNATLLKACIQYLIEVTGIHISTESTEHFFLSPNPTSFEFVVADVEDVVPRVKFLNIVDSAEAELAILQAEKYETNSDEKGDEATNQIIERFMSLARYHLEGAQRSIPCSSETMDKLRSVEEMLTKIGVERYGGSSQYEQMKHQEEEEEGGRNRARSSAILLEPYSPDADKNHHQSPNKTSDAQNQESKSSQDPPQKKGFMTGMMSKFKLGGRK